MARSLQTAMYEKCATVLILGRSVCGLPCGLIRHHILQRCFHALTLPIFGYTWLACAFSSPTTLSKTRDQHQVPAVVVMAQVCIAAHSAPTS